MGVGVRLPPRRPSWRAARPAVLAAVLGLACLCRAAAADIHYADKSIQSPQWPYTNPANAATNIQDAVDAAEDGDTVLVADGTYAAGGTAVGGILTNRVTITDRVTVRSLNGWDFTTILGVQPPAIAGRCAYVGPGAKLVGFTLREGQTATSGVEVAEQAGGAAWCDGGTISNCYVRGNRAQWDGGGIYSERWDGLFARHCTIAGNTADWNFGGVRYGLMEDCIIYYNESPDRDNYLVYPNLISYTCTEPEVFGPGNMTAAPGLLGLRNPHILPQSPCVNAGRMTNVNASAGADIDGEIRPAGNRGDLGCDEVLSGGIKGTLSVSFAVDYAQAAAGTPLNFEADIAGKASGFTWTWGDGRKTTNAFRTAHSYVSAGDYPVTLKVWNESSAGGGVSTTRTVQIVAVSTNYVAQGGSGLAPYTSWATAATNIQDAINAAVPGGTVLVGAGSYSGGLYVRGGVSNRVGLFKPVMVIATNPAPGATVIRGAGAAPGPTGVRCAYVGDGAVLAGFTLTAGRSGASGSDFWNRSGGGAWCEEGGVVSNCVVAGNAAARLGGGVYGGAAVGCTLVTNRAEIGGGAYGTEVRGGSIVSNRAGYGGGAFDGDLDGVLVAGNTATNDGGGLCYGTAETWVAQGAFKEKAVIVVGGPTNYAGWKAANAIGKRCYNALRSRWVKKENIRCLNCLNGQDFDSDGTNDVTATASLQNFQEAGWWASDAQKVSVWLIGDETNGTLRLNQTNELTAAWLAAWLDYVQSAGPDREACAVLEFRGAGGFLPALIPAPDRKRICIAAAQAGRPVLWAAEGAVSFTGYFLSGVVHGYSVRDSWFRARTAVRFSSGKLAQRALLDDNGDGKGTKYDGVFADKRWIGSAFKTGSDTPVIGAVTPSQVLAGPGTVTLWAKVTDMDGISNVWAVITPPGYSGQGQGISTNLPWKEAAQRYETDYGGVTEAGTYAFTFRAMDNTGEVSPPVQCEIVLGDGYEQDDTNSQAKGFALGDTQPHSLHAGSDADWVLFYAVTGEVYQVETVQWGTNVDTAVDVYWERPDGTLSNVMHEDAAAIGVGDGEMAIFQPAQPGVYFARVGSGEPTGWGTYDLTVWVPVGASGYLLVSALDEVDGWKAPPGSYAVVDGTKTQYFGSAGQVWYTGLSAGSHQVKVPTPAGYVPAENPWVSGGVLDPSAANVYGNPKAGQVLSGQPSGCGFMFYPMSRVRAVVRDADTGNRLEGAKLSFKAKSGIVKGTSYTSYQNAAWCARWDTDADGSLPDDKGSEGLMAPAATGDVQIVCAGYELKVWSNAVKGKAAGVTTNLGTVYLVPVDANKNGVADWWEAEHFPGGMGNPTNDSDGDGLDDGGEYGAGTDPTNDASGLWFGGAPSNSPSGFVLEWDSVPWRTYLVRGTNDLMGGGEWPDLSGALEAGAGQWKMTWTDGDGVPNRFYRVDVVLPP